MATCKDIYVTIHDFDPTAGYLVVLQPEGSVVDGTMINGYSQVALTQNVIFRNVTPGNYQICVRKTCANGATSEKCKDVVAPSCPVPKDVVITNDGTTASIAFTPQGSYGMAYSINGGPKIEHSGGSPIALVDLTPGVEYTVTFWTSCGVGSYSMPITKTFITDVIEPTFTKLDLQVVCAGSVYSYHEVLFTISGGTPEAGSVFAITQPGGALAGYVVQPGDTLLDIVMGLTRFLSVASKQIRTDSASFVLRIKDPEALYGCGDVAPESSFGTALALP